MSVGLILCLDILNMSTDQCYKKQICYTSVESQDNCTYFRRRNKPDRKCIFNWGFYTYVNLLCLMDESTGI